MSRVEPIKIYVEFYILLFNHTYKKKKKTECMLSFNGMGTVEWMPEAGKNPRPAG